MSKSFIESVRRLAAKRETIPEEIQAMSGVPHAISKRESAAVIRPPVCFISFVDEGGACARCHREPDHKDQHNYGGELGTLRWFLHDAPADDPLREKAEERWRVLSQS